MNKLLHINESVLDRMENIRGKNTNQLNCVDSIEIIFINKYKIKVLESAEYKMYELIRDAIYENIEYCNIKINTIGSIRRNTRYIIEGYINLLAILNDSDYIEVYKKECKEEFDRDIFNNFLKKYKISEGDILHKQQDNDYIRVNAKFKILKKIYINKNQKLNNLDKIKYFVNKYYGYNDDAHPNIFVKNNDIYYQDIQELININIYILIKSIRYIIYYFSTDEDWYNYYSKLLEDIEKMEQDLYITMNSLGEYILVEKLSVVHY